MVVKFYVVRIDRVFTDETPFDAWLSMLPLDDKCDVLAHKYRRDRERVLVSRLLQIAVIAAYTGVSAQDVCIVREPGAKPCAQSSTYIDYNVSHHGPWVVLACATIPTAIVGVDIVSKKEPAPLGFTPETWCRTEAYLKALGLGLSGLGFMHVPPFGKKWQEAMLYLDAEYMAIVVLGC